MRIRFGFLLLAAALVAPRVATAQDAERANVLATVQKLFDAMRTRDTALLLQAFDSSAKLVRINRRAPSPSVTLTPPSQFAAALVRAPAGDVWNERIYDPEVRIDGDIAQVWTYYTFHRNNTFSHCGIDAFMLAKVGTTWKITQLADTQRMEGCTKKEP
jgi:hypothetical protein